MKGKQLLLLLVLVGALGYAGWRAFESNRDSWSETGGGAGGKVVEFPINDVARLRVKTSGGEVNLIKGDDWTVKERADYPANYEEVSGLLRKLWDLKTVQEVKVGPSQLGRMELIEPGQGDGAGTLVEFKDKDGRSLASLIVGKKHLRKSEGGMEEGPGFPTGRYVMPVGAKSRVSLVSQTFDELEPKPERWLRKDFVKIENPKSVTLAGATDAQKWKLTRESATAEWKLADAKPDESLDTGKISPLTTAFANPTFKDVLAPDAKPGDTGLDKPSIMTIETTDNFTYKIEIGKLTDEAYPVKIAVSANLGKERTPGKDEKPEDKTKLDDEFKAALKKLEDKLAAEKKFESRAYVIERFTIDALLKDRAALLAEKKPDAPAPGAPTLGAPGAATPAPAPMPAPARAPVTVTTPPVSIPTATSPPVAVPPVDAAKPMPPASPETPAKPAPDAPTPPPAVPPAKPSVSSTTPPISVTTPPISVPPAATPPTPTPAEAAKPAPAPAPATPAKPEPPPAN